MLLGELQATWDDQLASSGKPADDISSPEPDTEAAGIQPEIGPSGTGQQASMDIDESDSTGTDSEEGSRRGE